ncbi:uncharacterized protein LOC143374045 [Andrena cerasifolii]|uniref:uncharacterized protein LOC143374045 n=1 Tax=Andrena cerasifolii TaxID=2819439 RepID=UPI0040377DCD
MKLLAVALTTLVAFATVDSHFLPAFGEGPLYEDVQYFMDMIPMEKVIGTVLQYVSDDAEVQEYVQYLKSDEFKQTLTQVEAIPEWHHFISYLQKNGLNMYDLMNKLNQIVGLPDYKPAIAMKTQDITGGLKGLFLDIKKEISYDLFIHGYVYKMRTSAAFRDFVAELKSSNHQGFVNALYKNQGFLKFRSGLVSKNMDVALVEDIIYTVLGIQFPDFKASYVTYDNQLSKDIREFTALLDMDKIMGIVAAHLEDDQVQKALQYLQGEEFHALVRKIEAMKEYQDLVLYLHNAGLDIFGLIQKVHKFFGMEDYVPPSVFGAGKNMQAYSNMGGLQGVVDEIVKTLPKDKLDALYEEKMRDSPAFRTFVEKLRSPEFKKLINTVYSTPIFVEMRQKAIDAGLDLAPVRILIKKIFGFDFPAPGSVPVAFDVYAENQLSKDIHEFTALLDMDKIMAIVAAHLEDDQVQKALQYLQGEEFHALVRKIEAMKEYQDLVLYLHNAGLDIFGLIQKVHKFFGMEDYVPPSVFGAGKNMQAYSNMGGLQGVVDEIVKTLPKDKLDALYEEKMRDSPAFRTFVEKLRSPEFKKLINTVYSTPIFVEMRQKAIDAGLDLAPVRILIKKIFGFDFPAPGSVPVAFDVYAENQLSKDIHEFTALLDMDKIMAIVAAHLEDDQVQKALQYLQGEEFHALVRKIEAMKEYQDLVLYLHNAGLDIFGLIQKVHKFFGMEDYVPPSVFGAGKNMQAYSNLGGLQGVVDEIVKTLPKDKLDALYEEKMRDSPAFRTFVEKLRSPEFKKLINTVYSTPIFVEMRQKAIDAGLDLAPVRILIKKIFGFDFPAPGSVPVAFDVYAENQLSKDIHEFTALLDMDKIMAIVAAHLEDDQVQKALQYLQSEEFHALVRKIEAMKEYQDLVLYLHNAGLDIFGLIQKIHQIFGMEDYVPPSVFGAGKNMQAYSNLGGLQGVVDEIVKTLPKDKLDALYEEKMRDSPAFRTFVEKLRSPEFKKLINTVYSTPIFVEMRQKAIDAGLDLAPVRILIKKIFGFDFPAPGSVPVAFDVYAENQLSKDIHEFTALLDMDKIMAIVAAHLEDDQVQKALQYLQSEEFHALVRKIEAMKEYQDLVLYLHNAGLDIFGLIQKIHQIFGMEDYVPPSVFGAGKNMQAYSNLGGLQGVVDEIVKTLPKDKLDALYEEKMRDSPAFRTFVEKLRSPEFKKLINTVYSTPIFVEMRQKAIDAGLDLAPVRILIKKIFGFDFPAPGSVPVAFDVYAENQLSKDIHEFTALLDMDKIMAIVAAHLEDDQVQKALQYLQGEEFHALVRKIEAMKEYQDLVLYLHNAGLDIFGLIQKVHKFFGMEDYVPPSVFGAGKNMQAYSNLGGLQGVVDEIVKTLPKDKLDALYEEKMRDSPAFRTFVEKLRSPEFKKLINTVYSTPIFVEMRQKAIDAGLDLAPVRILIKKIFGFDFPAPGSVPVAFDVYAENQLSKDIHEFTALLDMDKIMAIVAAHLEDDQVQKALQYLQSEEFHALVRKIEAMKEYQDLVLYLHNAGLDIFGLIQKIHQIFGMEDYVPPSVFSGMYMQAYSNLGGLQGVVDEIMKTLPKDKLDALYEEKMRDSPAFRTFVEKLRSPEFKKLINTVYSTPIFVEMRQKAIDAGLDLAPVRILIKKIFGFDFPAPGPISMASHVYALYKNSNL